MAIMDWGIQAGTLLCYLDRAALMAVPAELHAVREQQCAAACSIIGGSSCRCRCASYMAVMAVL
jgi:hypothetical protein